MSNIDIASPTIQTIDQLLSHLSKTLEAGQSVSIPLYKGATTHSSDPFKRVQKQDPDTCTTHLFPRVAKFSETTTKPDFLTLPWKDARLYEEDVPRINDDSDQEVEEEQEQDEEKDTPQKDIMDKTNTATSHKMENIKTKPKKRRWRRFEPPKRHWVLQVTKEFMEKLYIKQLKKSDPVKSSSLEKLVNTRLSERYQGSLEDKNTSQYAILSLRNNNNNNNNSHIPVNRSESSTFAISVTRIYGFHNFTQPFKTVTLSMQDAERFISDRRANMTRYMMHGKMSEKLTSSFFFAGPGNDKEDSEETAKAAAAAHVALASTGGSMGIYGPTPKGGLVKARLFNKLMNHHSTNHHDKSLRSDNDDMHSDDDDVMADVAFRDSKGVGRTVKARRELLSTFGGDGSLAVDDHGVISGSNDAEFAAKRQVFNRFVNKERELDQNYNDDDLNDDVMVNGLGGKVSDDRGVTASTSEGLAMDEDFYQRDVAMEYEDLDYDVNEQFDDDDVDLGDGDENIEDFMVDVDDDDDEEDLEDEDEDDDQDSDILNIGANQKISQSDNTGPVDGRLSNVNEGPKGSTIRETGHLSELDDHDASVPPPLKKAKLNMDTDQEVSASVSPTVQVDDNGDRVLTFDAVRKEIWLHSGRILLMQLAKIYNINKKTNPERRSKFVAITKELCNPEDSIEGKALVLKQHYSKFG